MIVLSAGMPKSGSGWVWNMTNDMLVAAGHDDARAVRDEHNLHHILKAANCNLRRLDEEHLLPLAKLSDQGKTFLVKTHRGPTPLLRKLVAEGKFKVMYNYRDLRDVVVSGMDRAKEMREKGELKGRQWGVVGPQKSFGKLTNIPMSILWVKFRVLPVWRAYTDWDEALITRYEDISADAVEQLRRIRAHLGLDLDDSTLEQIAQRYRREKIKQNIPGSGLHFNKGVAGRHKKALSPRGQRLCRLFLGADLKRMGYAID